MNVLPEISTSVCRATEQPAGNGRRATWAGAGLGSRGVKTAVMMGTTRALNLAFPPRLREAIGKRLRLHPLVVEPSAWKEQRDVLAQAEVVFSSWGMPALDADLLAAMPRLETVFHAAGTVKCFVTPEAKERGIVVCSAVGANAVPVAEYALGAILLGLRNFWGFQRATQTDYGARANVVVPGAFGSTVGLVSLGQIGRRVARLLANHNVNVLVHDPYARMDGGKSGRMRHASLEEVFTQSDVVSLHAPWLPETEKMVGASLVRMMKPGATLLNTARGAIVDEDGLTSVLRERPDLTAVLDVTCPEPPAADSLLRSLPNVVLTPHIAGSMGQEVARMGWWMAAESQRWLRGKPLRHQVELGALHRLA